jgi:predicted nucleic acid-binding protein
MSAKYFIDTNMFVYSFDAHSPEKIQEFLNVATRKFVTPFGIEDAKEYLRKVLNPLCQVYPDLSLYEQGLSIQADTGYGFYDSLIIAAAIAGGCGVLYSDDLQADQEIHSLKIINPFSGI